jgi:hypothetical protein
MTTPEKSLTLGPLSVLDTVGAAIFAHLVVDRVDRANGSLEDAELDWLADIALAAASAWGVRRHQALEPSADEDAP